MKLKTARRLKANDKVTFTPNGDRNKQETLEVLRVSFLGVEQDGEPFDYEEDVTVIIETMSGEQIEAFLDELS